MTKLISGLSEFVDDNEDIVRFLTQSSHFSSTAVKPSAFLPRPHEGEVSVSRHGKQPEIILWQLGEVAAGTRKLYGAAIFKAAVVRNEGLDIFADEPPPRHALLTGWPWVENDPQLQKARRKEIAIQLVSAAGLPFLR